MRNVILFAIIFVFASQSRAQWEKIAPNLLPPATYNGFAGGAICFKDGMLWAGAEDQFFSSSDSGRSWTLSTITGSPVHMVNDINFYDKFTGIMSQGYLYVFITHDGGLTWQPVFTNAGNISHTSFNHSPNIIHVLMTDRPDTKLYTSLDGGVTWSSSPQLGSLKSLCFTIGIDSTVYVHSLEGDISTENGGWINFSTDLGKTWSSNMSRTDGDCYAIAADSCDANSLYLANEEWVNTGNDSSKVYLTTNRGASWKTVFSHQRTYLSGTLATTKNVIYTGCVSPFGVLRSTDGGRTWKNIGGPSVGGDSHSLAVADDQTVFVIDADGSVWRTTNSGGDSLKDFPQVSLATEDVSADTIGENELQIPIKLTNLGEPRDVNCILHYDPPAYLSYQGSFSKSNVPLDILGEQWKGRSKLHIPGASSTDTISGYARFIVTTDSSIKPRVWFDSLEVFNAIVPCAIYDQFISLGNTATSNITMPSGCGTALLSDFLRTGEIPEFKIIPNPTNGGSSLISSTDIQDVNLIIYDMIGAERSNSVINLQKNIPLKITIPEANGIYNLFLKYATGTTVLRAIVTK